MYRMLGNLDAAQQTIELAFSKKPEWTAVQFAKALIDFNSALAPGILESSFCPRFEIINWPYIRRDDKSTKAIRSACDEFGALLSLAPSSEEQRHFFEGWKLTCLACDYGRQAEADKYCQDLLTSEPDHPVALLWALGRGYARTAIDESLRCLLPNHKTAKCGQLVKLLMCLAAKGDFRRALTILNNSKARFGNEGP
jgi:hypothetical protein